MDRLVLFDIDGTLVSGGPAKDAFHLALVEVFGTAGPIHEWEFSGKTDPQIARELLREAGLRDDAIDAGFPRLWSRYLAEMESRLPARPPLPLPGVPELLVELAKRGTVALALLTGNVAEGARLKLAAAGLWSWFAVGAFGSDRETRNELPTIAVRRARDHWGVEFSAQKVVVVGDTPRDVDCGRVHGARTVAVATGRFGEEALRGTGADAVLRDLGETELALEAILS
jgi:phosphoglycolate phosphatase-like HAD superfamily hydrolase